MPTVVLWDIDGTLVRSNGGRIAVTAFLRASIVMSTSTWVRTAPTTLTDPAWYRSASG